MEGGVELVASAAGFLDLALGVRQFWMRNDFIAMGLG
jgi:hypothetical protein